MKRKIKKEIITIVMIFFTSLIIASCSAKDLRWNDPTDPIIVIKIGYSNFNIRNYGSTDSDTLYKYRVYQSDVLLCPITIWSYKRFRIDDTLTIEKLK